MGLFVVVSECDGIWGYGRLHNGYEPVPERDEELEHVLA